MKRKVELVVTGLDLDDDATDDLLAEKLSDLGWFARDGVVTAAVYLDRGTDAVSAACDAARRIEHLTGASVLRVDEDIVGVSDIAQRTGLNRETVRLFALGKRGPGGFPAHRGTVGAGTNSTRVWRWDDVLPWLQAHYKLCEDEQPVGAYERAQINACLARVIHDFDDAWQRSARAPRVHAEVSWHGSIQEPRAVAIAMVSYSEQLNAGVELVESSRGFLTLCDR